MGGREEHHLHLKKLEGGRESGREGEGEREGELKLNSTMYFFGSGQAEREQVISRRALCGVGGSSGQNHHACVEQRYHPIRVMNSRERSGRAHDCRRAFLRQRIRSRVTAGCQMLLSRSVCL